MDSVILAAIIIIGGIIALLCFTLPVLIIVAGVYLITQVKQTSLNVREEIRSERAIMKYNFENSQYGADDEEGGLDLGGIMDVVTAISQSRATAPVTQTTEGTQNGIQTQQNSQ